MATTAAPLDSTPADAAAAQDGIKDVWILVCLTFSWPVCAVAYYFWSAAKRRRAEGDESWEDLPSKFIYDVKYQRHDTHEEFESTEMNKHVSAQKAYSRSSTFTGRSASLTSRSSTFIEVRKRHRMRSFERFCGGWPSAAPPPPKGTFQVSYRTKFRMAIYRKLALSALWNCWAFVLACGILTLSCTWWLRTADGLARTLGLEYLFNSEVVKTNMRAAYEVHMVMLPLASFSLAMFLNTQLSIFLGEISLVWSVQDTLHDVAMLAGGALQPRDEPVVRKARWTLYRYLNLLHFFLYQACYPRYESVALDDLGRAGLVTKEERRLLEPGAPDGRSQVLQLLSWTVTLMLELFKNGRIEEDVLHQALIALKNVRESLVVKELEKRPPMSFVQLMQIMIDILLLLTAPSMAYIFDTVGEESFSMYLWPMVGSVLLALFYQGGMRIITAMETPFGSDIDHLDVDWLLMASERAIYDLLACSAPSSILRKDMCDSDAGAGEDGREGERAATGLRAAADRGDAAESPEVDELGFDEVGAMVSLFSSGSSRSSSKSLEESVEC